MIRRNLDVILICVGLCFGMPMAIGHGWIVPISTVIFGLAYLWLIVITLKWEWKRWGKPEWLTATSRRRRAP